MTTYRIAAVYPSVEQYLEDCAKDEAHKYQREQDDPKWDQVLIDRDGTKLTRRQIRDYYAKHADQILKLIKGRPVLIYVSTGLNTNVLKRHHNEQPIVINTADEANSGKPDNLLYWSDRRLLSIHYVLGPKTDWGWVDLDLHGDYPLSKARSYAAEVVKALRTQLDVNPTIYSSGGTGLHIQFDLGKEVGTDDLRNQLKDLLDTLNQGHPDVSTGLIKGTGLRSDVSTLKNTGSLRVPFTLGETYGRIKQPLPKHAQISCRTLTAAQDPLKTYHSKRDFDSTPEPEGTQSKTNQHRYVIQRHQATHLHYDLRLENDHGTLTSFAIPKHRLPNKGERLLATQTEDHPVSYVTFSGTIDEGYGAGEVKIVSKGHVYTPIE